MMKMSNYRFLVFFIGVLLLSTISGQEIKNSQETFLGIGSGNRKIAKIQKSSISPEHTDTVTIIDNIKY